MRTHERKFVLEYIEELTYVNPAGIVILLAKILREACAKGALGFPKIHWIPYLRQRGRGRSDEKAVETWLLRNILQCSGVEWKWLPLQVSPTVKGDPPRRHWLTDDPSHFKDAEALQERFHLKPSDPFVASARR